MSSIDRPFRKGDFAQEQLLHQTIRSLPEGQYDVKITPKARECTAARGYLHGLVVPIYGAYLGECNRGQAFDDEEAWDEVKKQFRPREFVHPATGEVTISGRSTRGMTPYQLFEFTEEIRMWLESQGVPVPLPDKRWKQARERAMKEQQCQASAQ